jgi:predicted dehydrogenase
MVRTEYLPYLENRIAQKSDIQLVWASGCLCTDDERIACTLEFKGLRQKCEPGRVNEWIHLLGEEPVDGVIISLPNALHVEPVREALSRGVNVAVDKPTTISVSDCSQLVDLAVQREAVFVTLSQRRYEEVYQTIANIIRRGGLGDILLIDYLIAHEHFGRGSGNWTTKKSMAGGGALISSGYHGLDTILWLLTLCPEGPVCAKSVSAQCIIGYEPDAIETVAAVQIALTNGGIFNVAASFENPSGSLDENIKIFGRRGAVRLIRDRLNKPRQDQSAASLSYQHAGGAATKYDTKGWRGRRWAPLEDFINAVIAKKRTGTWSVLSPASQSLQTIRVIEKAYTSAMKKGEVIEL